MTTCLAPRYLRSGRTVRVLVCTVLVATFGSSEATLSQTGCHTAGCSRLKIWVCSRAQTATRGNNQSR